MTQNDNVQQSGPTDRLIEMAVDRTGEKGSRSKSNFLNAGVLANKFLGTLQECLNKIQNKACKCNVDDESSSTSSSSDSSSSSVDTTDEEDESEDDDDVDDDDKDEDEEDNKKWRLKQLQQISDRITLRRHGPAVQMDVHTNGKKSKLFYSVDMVPTIQIGKDYYYVAKPKKKRSGPQIEWRQSFSLDEKKRFLTLDKDNGCRKQVLRILKVMRLHKPDLARLSSFHYKTVLLRVTEKLTDKKQWKDEHIGKRLMDVIGQLEAELSEGVMPNYFLPDFNLLSEMSEGTIDNMRRRMRNLRKSQKRMRELMQSVEENY